jgi:hypothetical protein
MQTSYQLRFSAALPCRYDRVHALEESAWVCPVQPSPSSLGITSATELTIPNGSIPLGQQRLELSTGQMEAGSCTRNSGTGISGQIQFQKR